MNKRSFLTQQELNEIFSNGSINIPDLDPSVRNELNILIPKMRRLDRWIQLNEGSENLSENLKECLATQQTDRDFFTKRYLQKTNKRQRKLD